MATTMCWRVGLSGLAIAVLLAGCSSSGQEPETGDDSSAGAAGEESTSDPSGAVGLSDQEIEAEIDRVVAETRPVPAGATRQQKVAALVQCAEFLPDLRYCLVFGWTRQTEAELQAEFEAALTNAAGPPEGEPTGDLSPTDMVAQMVTQSENERAAAVRRELATAAAGIDKAQELLSE